MLLERPSGALRCTQSPAPPETAHHTWQLPRGKDSNPKGSKATETLCTLMSLGLTGAQPPPPHSWVLVGWVLLCLLMAGHSLWEPFSWHSHCTDTLRGGKKHQQKVLFGFKLQSSSLEPSTNTGNLLYSCLDLFPHTYLFINPAELQLQPLLAPGMAPALPELLAALPCRIPTHPAALLCAQSLQVGLRPQRKDSVSWGIRGGEGFP